MEFEQVVHIYSKLIYQTAYMYVCNRQAAEDITQDVLIQFYRKGEAFRGEASLKTYLTRMTYNRCYDYERSWKNKAMALIDKLTLKSSQNVEVQVSQSVERSELIEAVHALKPHYREVIILYYFNELMVREIADLIKVTENTVHTRLKRAREQLKANLQGWEGTIYEEAIRE